ncbi:uncharacterized protein BDW70DRAFT_129859 [Aspergillus foveolatus]|uniref:uncharacterized protein n=1 Tax=Aspergillus foveolatus TaxID=210207 RepID=UPI003CCCBCD4
MPGRWSGVSSTVAVFVVQSRLHRETLFSKRRCKVMIHQRSKRVHQCGWGRTPPALAGAANHAAVTESTCPVTSDKSC